MLALDFPDTFCSQPLIMLLASWATHFADGKRLSNLIRPADLVEAVAACTYYDELPPKVVWDKNTDCYKVVRRA